MGYPRPRRHHHIRSPQAAIYAVTLTVKDNKGLCQRAGHSHRHCHSAAELRRRTARQRRRLSTSCTNLACTFTDQSSDPDQTSASLGRSWNYGDRHNRYNGFAHLCHGRDLHGDTYSHG